MSEIDFNKVILTGTLTGSPKNISKDESRFMGVFGLNVNNPGKDGPTISVINIMCWDKNKRQVVMSLNQGDKILVEGFLNSRTAKDKSGNYVTNFTVINGLANTLNKLGNSKSSSQAAPKDDFEDDMIPW